MPPTKNQAKNGNGKGKAHPARGKAAGQAKHPVRAKAGRGKRGQLATPGFPLRPSGNRVVVRRQVPSELSQGGVLLPAQAQGKPQLCTVVAVGPGKGGLPVPYSVDDTVYVGQWSGTELRLPGLVSDADYLILDADEVLGTLVALLNPAAAVAPPPASTEPPPVPPVPLVSSAAADLPPPPAVPETPAGQAPFRVLDQ